MSEQPSNVDIVPAFPAFVYYVSRWVLKWYRIDGPGYMIKASGYKNAYFIAARVSGGYSPTSEIDDIIVSEIGENYIWGIWAVSCGTGFELDSKIPSLEPNSEVIPINKIAQCYSACPSADELGYSLSITDPEAACLQSFVDSRDTSKPVSNDLTFNVADQEWFTGIVYALSDYISSIRRCMVNENEIDGPGYMIKANHCKNACFVAARVNSAVGSSVVPANTEGIWGIWAVGCGDGSPSHLKVLSINDVAGRFSNCPAGREIRESLSISDPDATRLLSFVENLSYPEDTKNNVLQRSDIQLALPDFITAISNHLPVFYSTSDRGYMVKASQYKDAYFVAVGLSRASEIRWEIWAVGCGKGFELNSVILSGDSSVVVNINDIACNIYRFPIDKMIRDFLRLPDPDAVHLLSFIAGLPKDR